MTPEEIRHHALAIAEMRRSKRSKGATRRAERGFDTQNDFRPQQVRPSNHRNMSHGSAAVDRMFDLHARTGQIPRGCWS